MARGGYLGGSTVVGPRSGWFSFGKSKKPPKMARIAGQDRFAVIQREKREAIKAAKAERVKRAAERRRAAKAAEAKRKAKNAERRREEQAGKKQQRKDEMEKRKRITAKGLTGIEVVRRKVPQLQEDNIIQPGYRRAPSGRQTPASPTSG